jgi:hypothetical protein
VRRCRTRADRGTALFSTAIGVLVFLLFLLFAVQLLVSLYATSTVTAVTNDAVQRAASGAQPDLGAIEAEARSSLGAVGRAAEFTWSRTDDDGDGFPDTISLEVVAHPPRFLPRSVGDAVGLTEIDHIAVARLEGFR